MIGNSAEATIRSIVDTYERIDSRIIFLMQSSSEDFLNFNTFFKNYFKEFKSVTDLASDVFCFLEKPELKAADEWINRSLNTLETTTYNNQSRISDALIASNRLDNSYKSVFAPFHNMKQNLVSLKLLLVNVQLSRFENQVMPATKKQTITDIGTLVKNALLVAETIEKKLAEIEQLNSANGPLLENLNAINKQLQQLTEKNRLTRGSYFGWLNSYSKSQAPLLQGHSKQVTQSYSEIITNLQYQDIIKQKIEHIQHTHSELINELTQINETCSDNYRDELHQIFNKICYITGIQSAQLFHANKKFQQAIQNILGKFIDMSTSMTAISGMYKELMPNKSSQPGFDEIIEMIDSTRNRFISFVTTFEVFDQQASKISHSSTEIYALMGQMGEQIHAIEEHFNVLSGSSSTEALNTASLLSDLQHLHVQTTLMIQNHQRNAQELDNVRNSIGKHISDFTSIVDPENETPRISSVISTYQNRIEEVNKEVTQRAVKAESDFSNAVKDIKYYNYFEKTIEEINSDLNSVIGYFESEPSGLIDHESIELEVLKKRYTMNSEHLIHERMTNKLENGEEWMEMDHHELTDISENESTDDDNLELF